ncbi:hypothetical protein NED98_20145 [Sphingomonas sp. MMSM20]|uniref:hypothetical protein n=1 Tax=Sphingomonas lycopersici TaxID=2951807 RepID=UPI00223743D7|nr:hypothetical protein [Sphingomonas lycopersici]MCW6532565.1 hypothetical protein [Sphingomonas lycopersici]
MGELLWSAFSNPKTIASAGDAPFVVVAALIVAMLTFIFMATVGQRIMRVSRTLAVLAGTTFVPAIGILIAYALLCAAPDGPPPNDGPAMLFMALLVLSICTVPISLIVSAVYVVRRRREDIS